MIAIQKVHSFTDAFNYNDKKLNLPDKNQRAELLDHNFLDTSREAVLQEIKMINSLHSNRMKNDGYHVALSFSGNDKISDKMLKAIADDYKKGMGFSDDHLFLLYKHNDGEDHKHIHVHLLLHRLSIDPNTGKTKLVSDSNNYQRSEKLCREIEKKYGLETVRSSKEAQDRSPNKDELEMIQRTGRISDRMLMQELVKDALSKADSMIDFINRCKENGVYLLFNQSESTGRVSGVTYVSVDGFIVKGQKLGNQFKWSNLITHLNYEQSRDRQTIGETNSDTRERFKNLLNQGNRGTENRNTGNSQNSKQYHEESARFTSDDRKDFQDRGKSGFNSHSERANNNAETEQEFEETVSNQFSTGASAIISSVSGLLGSIGGDEIDEDEKRRKRKSRR
jgi:hypothetical protein